jgi:hypothetical protein
MRSRNLLLLASLLFFSLPGFTQHIELGGFGSFNHFDLPPFANDAVGVGGRLDIGLWHYLALEGEGSYDFKHPTVQIVSTGVGFNVTQFRLGVVHANGGFKIQTKGGSYFLFLKGGILNFYPDIRTSTLVGTIQGTVPRSGTSFSEAVFYPGAGIGFHAGILGIRVDAGDEIYWDQGTHHNLRITFGPTLRF